MSFQLDDGDAAANKIHEEDRAAVKQSIVNLMLKSPESIQRQLSDAISVIGKEDFPNKWPSLLPEMVSKFSSGNLEKRFSEIIVPLDVLIYCCRRFLCYKWNSSNRSFIVQEISPRVQIK